MKSSERRMESRALLITAINIGTVTGRPLIAVSSGGSLDGSLLNTVINEGTLEWAHFDRR